MEVASPQLSGEIVLRDQKQMNSIGPGSTVQNQEQDSCCGTRDATAISVPNNSGTV